MENVIIRKGNISDLDDIQKLSQGLFEFEVGWHKTYVKEWPYSEGGIQFFSKRLKEEDGVIFIAKVDNKIVGYLCGGWIRSYGFRKEKLFFCFQFH